MSMASIPLIWTASKHICSWLRKTAVHVFLCLFVLSCVIWIRSLFVGDAFTARIRGVEAELKYESGRLQLVVRIMHSAFRPAALRYHREVVAGWRGWGLKPPETPAATIGPI